MSTSPKTSDNNSALADSVKTIKKKKKWTLLLIGNYGEIISVRNFIGLMTVVLIALLLAIAAAISFFILYKNTAAEAENLRSALKESQDQVLSQKEEKDLLMVNLVVAREENKALKSKVKQTKKNKTLRKADLQKEQTGTSLKQQKKPSEKNIKNKPAIQPATVAEKKTISKVAVDNFLCSLSTDNRNIETKFKLINKSSKAGAVSGYTFVLLKNNKKDKKQCVILPRVAIPAGKPAQFKKGRFFSILRYTTIKFKQQIPAEHIENFNEAVVFVYASNGDLMLEKVFSVSIKLKPAKASTAANPEVKTALPADGNIQTETVKPVSAEKSNQIIKSDEIDQKNVKTKPDVGDDIEEQNE